MKHKHLLTWAPRLLIMAILVVGLCASVQADLLHLPGTGLAQVGGAAVMLANVPLGLPDMWKVTTLTEAIQILPETPTRIGASGLFEEESITTPTAGFDTVDGSLTLVANSPRGSDGVPVKNDKPTFRVLPAAHLTAIGVLKAEDFEGVRTFGNQDPAKAQAQIINNRLQAMKNRIAVTKEFHRMGALRGKILDADGSVLLDLYDAFKVTKKTANLALGTAGTDVLKKITDAKRAVEPKMGGMLTTGWRCYCSASFYDALVSHANVKAAYAGWQAAADRLGGDMRNGFVFGGVEFIEYNATVSAQAFMPNDLATMFPVAPGLYKLYNAPADYNESVNTMGLPIYAKAEERRMGKGWDLEAQACPLAICTRPDVLTELSLAA